MANVESHAAHAWSDGKHNDSFLYILHTVYYILVLVIHTRYLVRTTYLVRLCVFQLLYNIIIYHCVVLHALFLRLSIPAVHIIIESDEKGRQKTKQNTSVLLRYTGKWACH